LKIAQAAAGEAAKIVDDIDAEDDHA